MTRSEQRQIAAVLAEQLRRLADAAERAAEGDADARALLSGHIDGYWHKIVLGRGMRVPGLSGSYDIQDILRDACPYCDRETPDSDICADCRADLAARRKARKGAKT